MDREGIAKIRDRMRRIRQVASMAHDPQMIEMLIKIAEDGEAEAARLVAQVELNIEIEIEPPRQA